jgi:hypothetical protein
MGFEPKPPANGRPSAASNANRNRDIELRVESRVLKALLKRTGKN